MSTARDLEERVLAIWRRILGAEHPNTTISAWNLFRTLEDMGERDAAQAVLDRDLAWLLHRDTARLGADQRNIQGYLRDQPSHGYPIE